MAEDEWQEVEQRLYYSVLSDDVTCLKRMIESEGHNINTKFEVMKEQILKMYILVNMLVRLNLS